PGLHRSLRSFPTRRSSDLLGLYGIWRWIRRRRDALPARQIVHIVALGLLAVVVGFSWQVLAGMATGRADAYLATELAWRRTAVSDRKSTRLNSSHVKISYA